MANFEILSVNETTDITLDEIKNQLRIDYNDEDLMLTGILAASCAIASGEMYGDVYSTIRVGYFYSGEEIVLTEPLIQSVDEVKVDGVVLTLDEDYEIIKRSRPTIVFKKDGQYIHNQYYTKAEIKVTTGFTKVTSEIVNNEIQYTAKMPADIKYAILAQVAYLYENRGDVESSSGKGGISTEARAVFSANRQIIF